MSTEKHPFNVVNPQEVEEMSQMILKSLSGNILKRPSSLFIGLLLGKKSKPGIRLILIYEEE